MDFQYKALLKNKMVKGRMEAASETDIINYLKSNNYFPIEIKKVEPIGVSFLNQVDFTDVVNLTRQIAIMLNAGLTLVDSFDILKKQTVKVPLLALIEDIDKSIRGGETLSAVLSKYPQHFSHLYISLVKAGEASGKLNDILLKLADNLEKQRDFRTKIKGALTYPAVVISAMFIVMFIMVTFVLPKLLDIYKNFDVELPFSTRLLIAVSSFASLFWPIIVAVVVFAIVALRKYLKTKAGKYLIDSICLKIPILSNVIKMSVLVDSTRTLSILIGSGISILDGLNIIIQTSSNVVYQQAFQEIYKQVEKGTSLGTAMSKAGIFPPLLVQMTTVGEQTGHLDDTLIRVSHYFEIESDSAVKAMTTLIEPAILITLGLGVGFLVFSIITPIYQLTDAIK